MLLRVHANALWVEDLVRLSAFSSSVVVVGHSSQTVRVLDAKQLRDASRGRLPELGFPDPPPHLPVLFEPVEGYTIRPIDDIIARTVVLNVAIAVSLGMPRDLAQRWISDNGVEAALSPLEATVIGGDKGVDTDATQAQVEAIWAFVWVLSLGENLDPSALCPDDLVRRVPNLPEGESLDRWRERTDPILRSADQVMSELDLHYCMTWGLAEANLRGLPSPGEVGQYTIWQRRRALEFAIAERSWTHGEWDNIDLST